MSLQRKAVAYTNTTADGTALNLRYGDENWGLSISNFVSVSCDPLARRLLD
jgi:hypothetical protein